ncbi:hypothetical protein ACT4US_19840, partial [Bacillus sp. HC-Mk]
KKLTKTEIVQEKESITKQTAVRSIKNEKVIHQLEQPLPTDKIRKTLVEWERTLPFHEQRSIVNSFFSSNRKRPYKYDKM